jgi:hypothetical protein
MTLTNAFQHLLFIPFGGKRSHSCLLRTSHRKYFGDGTRRERIGRPRRDGDGYRSRNGIDPLVCHQ